VKALSATRQRLSVGEISRREKTAASTPKKPVRATVVNPREIDWPEVDAEGSAKIIGLIERLGKYLVIPHRKVPLKEIRSVEKAERKEFRQTWITRHSTQVGYDISNYLTLRSCLIIGVNCVSKALETDVLAAAIIEKSVNPPIITKLLVPLAVSRNVPMVAIDGLNSAFQHHAGMRCIAVGLKKCCEDNTNTFYPLLAAITFHLKEAEDAKRKAVESESKAIIPHTFNLLTPGSSESSSQSSDKKPSSKTDFALKPTKIRKVAPK